MEGRLDRDSHGSGYLAHCRPLIPSNAMPEGVMAAQLVPDAGPHSLGRIDKLEFDGGQSHAEHCSEVMAGVGCVARRHPKGVWGLCID